MATTTATFSLSSSDLMPSQSLSITSTNRLYKAGSTEGVDQVRMGRNKLTSASVNYDLIDATALGQDKANNIYIANKSTDASHYVTVTIIDQEVGRLYAGDWMWLPCNFDGATSDIEVQGSAADIVVEWAMIHEGETLGTAG